jgi:hypothetical protein
LILGLQRRRLRQQQLYKLYLEMLQMFLLCSHQHHLHHRDWILLKRHQQLLNK